MESGTCLQDSAGVLHFILLKCVDAYASTNVDFRDINRQNRGRGGEGGIPAGEKRERFISHCAYMMPS